MHERKPTISLRRVWRFAKRILLGLALAILVTAWLLVGGLNLYCAIQLTCNTAALTWWSTFISVVGLPVLVVQIYLLRKTLEEGIWKPILSVGVINAAIRPDLIMEPEDLPDRLNVSFENFANAKILVIRNRGKAAAKSAKIQVSLVQYPPQPSIPRIRLNKAQYLSGTPVAVVELDTLIHPGDFSEFTFEIQPDTSDQCSGVYSLVAEGHSYIMRESQSLVLRRLASEHAPNVYKISERFPYGCKTKNSDFLVPAYEFSRQYVVGDYSLEVKIWAEGINPVRKMVHVVMADFPSEIRTRIEEIAKEASEYEIQKRSSSFPL